MLTPMTHRRGFRPIRAETTLACGIFTILLAPSLAQTPTKKTTPALTKPDRWQRSRECAVQAEKMVAEWPQRTGSAASDWNNHYSPKYDKCYVSIYLRQLSTDEKVFPTIFQTLLFDAFERSAAIASSCTVIVNSDCAEQILKTGRDVMLESVSKRLYDKPLAEASADERKNVRATADRILHDVPTKTATFCGIDGNAVDCAKAASFIAEHMKN